LRLWGKEMRLRRNYNNNTSFLDLLFNTLVGFVLLFIVSFLLIAPVTEKDVKIQAEFIITMTWPHDGYDDIDVWLEDPIGNILYFQNEDLGLMHLDRDDLGSINDTITLPSGEEIVLKVNQEIVTIRGFIPGEWILNIHLYKRRNELDEIIHSNLPVDVEVRMDKLNPKVTTIVYKNITLSTVWQEETVARFVMAANGDITDVYYLPKGLVKERLTHHAPHGGL